MIKQVLIGLALLTAETAFCQMSDRGYKDLKLGMTVEEAKTVVNFTLKDDIATVTYDGVPLELSFTDNDGVKLWVIKSESPIVKLLGVNESLIGKHYKAVKSLLGNKLNHFENEEDFDPKKPEGYFPFYADKKSIENDETSCVLNFDEKGILIEIFAAYNP